jgi:two-component system, LytTR family, response regulator
VRLPPNVAAEHKDIEVVAQCQNGEEAVSYLRSKPSDPLFLDVQMPKMGGFDVIENLGLRQLPPTAFVDGLS